MPEKMTCGDAALDGSYMTISALYARQTKTSIPLQRKEHRKARIGNVLTSLLMLWFVKHLRMAHVPAHGRAHRPMRLEVERNMGGDPRCGIDLTSASANHHREGIRHPRARSNPPTQPPCATHPLVTSR